MVATNAFGMGIDKSMCAMCFITICRRVWNIIIRKLDAPGVTGKKRSACYFFSKQDIMINKRLLQYKSTSGQASDDPALRANEQRKLNEMIRYCETDECSAPVYPVLFRGQQSVYLRKMQQLCGRGRCGGRNLYPDRKRKEKRHCSLLI